MEDQAITMLEGKKDYLRSSLIGTVTLLRDRMDRVLTELERENPIINGCGEVQGLGAAVDTRCAEYAILRYLLEEYKGRKEAIEEQAQRMKEARRSERGAD